MNRLTMALATALGGSVILNVTRGVKYRKIQKENNDLFDGLARTDLVEILNNIRSNKLYKNKKGENEMKLNMTSTRTKILGGFVIALTAATTLSVVNDLKAAQKSETVAEAADEIAEAVGEVVEAVEIAE